MWPENLPKQSSQDEMELVQDEVVIEEPAPIELDWSEEHEHEDVSNCGDIIFEQDIPASLEEEVVTNSGTEETECDDNSDYCSQSSHKIDFDVISRNREKQLPDVYVPVSSKSRDLSKADVTKLEKLHKPTVKFKQTLMVSRNLLKLNQRNFSVDLNAGTSLLKSKVREIRNDETTLRKIDESDPEFIRNIILKKDLPRVKSPKKSKHSGKKHRHRTHGEQSGGKSKSGKVSSSESKSSSGAKKFVDLHGENITINHEADESGQANRFVDLHGENITIHHVENVIPPDLPAVIHKSVSKTKNASFTVSSL